MKKNRFTERNLFIEGGQRKKERQRGRQREMLKRQHGLLQKGKTVDLRRFHIIFPNFIVRFFWHES